MKGFFGKFIPLAVIAAVALTAAVVTTSSVAQASGYVTIMTPAAGSEELVIDGTRVGTFPVYNGTGQIMFSWTRYWAPYWPTYPNPQHTDKSYKVSIWQNVTPLSATPTWVELHTSHHWIDDSNPTRFTFDAFLDSEQLCQNCPSVVAVQPERILAERDANGNVTAVHCEHLPETKSGSAGASAYKVKGNIHWVSCAHALQAEVRLYDRLFKVPFPGSRKGRDAVQQALAAAEHRARLDEEDVDRAEEPDIQEDYDFRDDLNADSTRIITACLEPGLASAKPEERFQFERHGYFVADRADSKPGRPVFNRAVTLRDSWGKQGG